MGVEVYISFLLPQYASPGTLEGPNFRPISWAADVGSWQCAWFRPVVTDQFCWIKIEAYTYKEYEILVGTKWCEMRLYLNLGSSHSAIDFIPVSKLIYIQFCNSLDADSFLELWGAGLHSHSNMRQIIVMPWNTTSEKPPYSFWHTVPWGARFTVWGTTPCKATQTTTISIRVHFMHGLAAFPKSTALVQHCKSSSGISNNFMFLH